MAEQALAILVHDINSEHAQCVAAMTAGLEHAIRAGELLADAKSACQHGTWVQWVVDNCQFTPRQAQRYMLVAERKDELLTKTTRESHLSFRGALALLSEPKAEPADNSGIPEIMPSDAPAEASPPPVPPRGDWRFSETFAWSKRRLDYIRLNPSEAWEQTLQHLENRPDRSKRMPRHSRDHSLDYQLSCQMNIVRLELQCAAGRLFRKISETYFRVDIILPNAGKVIVTLGAMMAAVKVKLVDGLPVGHVDLRDGLAYPWSLALLIELGWVDADGAPLREFTMDEAADLAFELHQLLVWHLGRDPWEGAQVPHEAEVAIAIPEGMSERAWSELVLMKYQARGLVLTPVGIPSFPEALSLDEYQELGKALFIQAKYSADEKLAWAARKTSAPADYAILGRDA